MQDRLERAAQQMISPIRALVYKMGFRPKYGTVLYSPTRSFQLSMKNINWDDMIFGVSTSKFCHTCSNLVWQNGHWVHQKALLNPGEHCESCGRGRPVGEERVRIEVAVADSRYCTACFKWTHSRPDIIHGVETLEFGICTACGTPYHEN